MNDWDGYEYAPPPGEPADDVFDGGEGDDSLDSTGGADVLLGGPGSDDLRKSRGAATLDGGPGRDRLSVYLTAGRHAVSGGDGRDEVLLSVLATGRGARGDLDHARGRFVVRLAHRVPVRAAVARVERVAMPHDAGRWTYLGTAGDDHVEERVVVHRKRPRRRRRPHRVVRRRRAARRSRHGTAWWVGRGDDRCRAEELVAASDRRRIRRGGTHPEKLL